MKCRNCNTEIQDGIQFCPVCGSKTVQEAANVFTHDISVAWPDWTIEKQLGRGSYGVVYQAVRKDSGVESRAAIKVISIPSDSSEVDSLRSEGLDINGTRSYFKGIVDDFVSEIQLMESLKGIQNIVSVEDYKVVEKTDTVGWEIYIRMELLTSFNSYICDRAMSEAEVIKLGCDICQALEICSQRNIIHRDIKPENIFVNDFGYFKLGDFGIARKLENMTGGLSQKGTFNYMAPEVATSTDYDARVDTYSLGLVLYRLLNNNRLPFLDTEKQVLSPNERRAAVDRRIRGEDLPAPIGASREMADVILRACSFVPASRFESPTEMKQALLSVANGTYVVSDPDVNKTTRLRSGARAAASSVGSFGDGKKKSKKAKIIAIIIAAAIACLAIGCAIFYFTSDAYSVYKSFTAEEFDDALYDYRQGVEDSFFEKLILDFHLDGSADTVADQYKNGKKDFETTHEALVALTEMGYGDADKKDSEIMSAYATEISKKFASGDIKYKEAKSTLDTLKGYGCKDAQSFIEAVMEAHANDTVDSYNSGKTSYEDAKKTLQNLKKDGYSKADSLIDTVTLSNNADESLKEGTQLYEDGNYEDAITELEKIPEGNENYKAAQEKLEAVYADYIDSVAAAADKSTSAGNYTSAIQKINTAYGILPDSLDTAKLDTAKESALAAYKSEIAEEVADYVEDEKYTEAFNLISEAIEFDDNEYFRELKTTTEGNYVTSVTTTVQEYLDDGDYVSAKRVADNSLTVLPQNAALEDLVDKVEKETPTFFADVFDPYSSSRYGEKINGETVTMGGTSYTNGFTIYEGGNAVFNIDAKYTSMSFTLGHIDGSDMGSKNVKIYCDGILKTEIEVNAEALPERYTIDITGVKQLKIVVSGISWDGSGFGFVNATVE